jgi:hypothetical protein
MSLIPAQLWASLLAAYAHKKGSGHLFAIRSLSLPAWNPACPQYGIGWMSRFSVKLLQVSIYIPYMY